MYLMKIYVSDAKTLTGRDGISDTLSYHYGRIIYKEVNHLNVSYSINKLVRSFINDNQLLLFITWFYPWSSNCCQANTHDNFGIARLEMTSD